MGSLRAVVRRWPFQNRVVAAGRGLFFRDAERGQVRIGAGGLAPALVAGKGGGEAPAGFGELAEEAGVAGEVIIHQGAGAGDQTRAGEQGFLGLGHAVEFAQGVGPGHPRALGRGVVPNERRGAGENLVPGGFGHGEFDAEGKGGGRVQHVLRQGGELGAGLGMKVQFQVAGGVGEVFFR
jgi:hypothetical protein